MKKHSLIGLILSLLVSVCVITSSQAMTHGGGGSGSGGPHDNPNDREPLDPQQSYRASIKYSQSVGNQNYVIIKHVNEPTLNMCNTSLINQIILVHQSPNIGAVQINHCQLL